MPIAVACPQCGQTFQVSDRLAGTTGRCSGCQSSLQIPALRKRGMNPAVLIGNIVFLGGLPLATAAFGIWWLALRPKPAPEVTVTAATKPANPAPTPAPGNELVALADADPAARLRAVRGLRGTANLKESTAAALVGLLADADAGVAQEAAKVLGNANVSVKKLAGDLIAALKSKHETGRVCALKLLGSGDLPADAAAPVMALADDAQQPPAVRAAAVRALGKLPFLARAKMLEMLGKMAGHSDAEVSEAAADVLRQPGHFGVEGLTTLRALLKSGPPAQRLLAAELLHRYKSDAAVAVPELSAAAESDDADLRRTALVTLAAVGPERTGVVAALLRGTDDRDAGVRRAAAVGLSRVGRQPGVLEALMRAAEKSPTDAALIAAVERGLASFEPLTDADAPALARGLTHPNATVRAWCVRHAGSAAGLADAAVPELAAKLKDATGAERRQLLVALTRILAAKKPTDADAGKYAAIAEGLLPLLDGKNEADAAAALDLLAKLGPAAAPALPALQELVANDSLATRALECLLELGPAAKPVIPTLLVFLSGQKIPVNQRAYALTFNGQGVWVADLENTRLDPARTLATRVLAKAGTTSVGFLAEQLVKSRSHALKLGLIRAFAEMGSDARDALDALGRITAATDRTTGELKSIRTEARRAIDAIKSGRKVGS